MVMLRLLPLLLPLLLHCILLNLFFIHLFSFIFIFILLCFSFVLLCNTLLAPSWLHFYPYLMCASVFLWLSQHLSFIQNLFSFSCFHIALERPYAAAPAVATTFPCIKFPLKWTQWFRNPLKWVAHSHHHHNSQTSLTTMCVNIIIVCCHCHLFARFSHSSHKVSV